MPVEDAAMRCPAHGGVNPACPVKPLLLLFHQGLRKQQKQQRPPVLPVGIFFMASTARWRGRQLKKGVRIPPAGHGS